MSKRYFFCGVGGFGMSPLARLLVGRGHTVIGSDRSYDQGKNGELFAKMQAEGIKLFPQDGSGVSADIDQFIVTRAVEDSIPDIAAAKALELKITKRPLLMAEVSAGCRNVMVGGTSGKSTVTGMIGFILDRLGHTPTIINGASMLNFGSSFVDNHSDLLVFEADESDGSQDVIATCSPTVAVLTNVSHDHFGLDELKSFFADYLKRASLAAVVNADCPVSQQIRPLGTKVVSFGLDSSADISPSSVAVKLKVPGQHNLANALAAIAACVALGCAAQPAAAALAEFSGIARRLELVGSANGVAVIDDFASNPAKIRAGIDTLLPEYKRLILIFQPHGFQPTKMMRSGYVETFSEGLRSTDLLVMPEIFYAGGSANLVDGKLVALPTDISSKDLIDEIKPALTNSFYFADRREIPRFIGEQAQAGDAVVVMGSRDETLPEFAREILTRLSP